MGFRASSAGEPGPALIYVMTPIASYVSGKKVNSEKKKSERK